jgi:hypothetical protein
MKVHSVKKLFDKDLPSFFNSEINVLLNYNIELGMNKQQSQRDQPTSSSDSSKRESSNYFFV